MKRIIYPSVNSKSYSVGVTAPSSGLGNDTFIRRYELIAEQFKNNGINIIEGKCLRDNYKYVSASQQERVEDLLSLWKNPEVDLILPPWGGEILIEILDLIDYTALVSSPKWIQGFSDTSTLLMAITIKTGIATAHGANFMDSILGQEVLTTESRNYLSVELGGSFTQKSSIKWQKKFVDFKKQVDATYNLTEKTEWKVLNRKSAAFSGRIIGGCIDTVKHLIGTPYGDIKKFYETYAKDDGLIIYLENCEETTMEHYRSLTSMKYAGWFDDVKGIIFGRNSGPENEQFTYLNCLEKVFEGCNFPVIYDADIGHKPPQMTVINGAIAELKVDNGSATLRQKFI